MATSTYELIETTTLSASASSVTFSSITQDYRDLVLVFDELIASSFQNNIIRFNGDSGSNYSYVQMDAVSGSPSSASGSGITFGLLTRDSNPADGSKLMQINIMDYSATDKHKSFIARASSTNTTYGPELTALRWASTSAITSLVLSHLSGGNFGAGSTFSLYGIA